MEVNLQQSVFVSEDGKSLSAKDLIDSEELFANKFPSYELSQSYWDVGFEYYFIDDSHEKIDIYLQLKNKRKILKIIPPNFLIADYFIVDKQIIPLRRHDYEALKTFLPTLDHDGILGFTVKELMNFDFFASKNNFEVENPELN